VEREPILEKAAYMLILAIGIELVLEDLAKIEITDWLRFGISISIILLTVAYAHFKILRVFRPLLVWLGQGFAHLNDLVNWILVPFIEVIKLLWKILSYPFFSARANQK
jgi:tellurite resistance protein TerC